MYDVTDDWLAAPSLASEKSRLAALDETARHDAEAVVVCSPTLAARLEPPRPVTVVPNAVDVEHFRRSQPRPADLPEGPVAVYVGSLHEARVDVGLVDELARSLPEVSVVLVGPDSLEGRSRAMLAAHSNVSFLGARPYALVPAYLQHANVIVVPHAVNAFTESLDPIKAYECLASGTPTVATPVAGFRELAPAVHVVDARGFCAAVKSTLSTGRPAKPDLNIDGLPSWRERAELFEEVLRTAAHRPAEDPEDAKR